MAEFIAQANAEGVKGNGYVGNDGSGGTLYFTSTNCTGFLCDTHDLFGY